jgi:hypothetical protein
MMEPQPGSQTDIAPGAIPTPWLGKRQDISLYDTFLFVFGHDVGGNLLLCRFLPGFWRIGIEYI